MGGEGLQVDAEMREWEMVDKVGQTDAWWSLLTNDSEQVG